MWYPVQDALNYSKIFPSIQLLKLYNQSHIDLKFTCDSKHNILSQEKISWKGSDKNESWQANSMIDYDLLQPLAKPL